MKAAALLFASGVLLASVAGFAPTPLAAQPAPCLDVLAPGETRVLVFSRTAGFRHESIADGLAAIRALGERHRFAVEHTEDAAQFNDERLTGFDVVVFLNTTGTVLDGAQKAAFERFVRGGGGFVGVHAAADTEYDWEWYGRLVGAYFRSHPPTQSAMIRIVDSDHLSTRCVPPLWTRTDEWYDYRQPPEPSVTVLAALDESTYQGGRMGDHHPIAWYHEFDGGRAWYTGLGHTSESYSEPAFLDHLAGGILWAAGL
jgi:type 1 glutamine amidotransferase